jgi:L-fuculose-phosphate aldolase
VTGGGEARLRQEICEVSRRLHARGWVANHDGNVSVRTGDARVLCTPTATSKAEVTPEGIVILESLDDPSRIVGRGKPPGEINLHLCAYQVRPDARAVVHAHPPTATGFGVAGVRLLERPVLAEAVVSLGPCVPTVPLTAPGKPAAAALAPFLREHDVVLIAGNGVVALGDSLEQAYLRLELVEHLARIALTAHQLGAAPAFPAELLPPLLEARRKAGLGPEARGVASARPAAPTDEVARLVREELVKALGKA